MAKQKEPRVFVKGAGRLMCVNPDGSVAWRTPWIKNVIVNEGFDDYIIRGIFSTDSSKHIDFMALASGSDLVPNVTHTTMPQEITNSDGSLTRKAITSISISQSKTVEAYVTFASGSDQHFSASMSLQGLGLYDNSTNTGTLFSWLTFATQQVSTNQQVNATYQLSFDTA